MDNTKLVEFVAQLSGSAAIKTLGPVDREDSILTIINSKSDKLIQTFSQPDYYPGVNWGDIKTELMSIIENQSTEMLKVKIQNVLFQSIQNFMDFQKPDQEYREKLLNLINKIISRASSRKKYGKVIAFIESNLLTSFILPIYNNRRFIFRGLNRFEGIPLKTAEAAIDFIYTALLLMPLYEITLPSKVVMPPQFQNAGNNPVALADLVDNAVLSKSFLLKIKDIIVKELPETSNDFIDMVAKAFFVEENMDCPYNSQFLSIIYRMALDYNPVKKDKGADSFAMSWMNVARVNYKFYEYDYNTIDELYKITLEEDI